MGRFIHFLEGNFEHIDLKALNMTKDERVSVASGIFKGKNGANINVMGKRNRQVAVADGLLAVAIKAPNPSQIIEKY